MNTVLLDEFIQGEVARQIKGLAIIGYRNDSALRGCPFDELDRTNLYTYLNFLHCKGYITDLEIQRIKKQFHQNNKREPVS
jgi:hypothetical protein